MNILEFCGANPSHRPVPTTRPLPLLHAAGPRVCPSPRRHALRSVSLIIHRARGKLQPIRDGFEFTLPEWELRIHGAEAQPRHARRARVQRPARHAVLHVYEHLRVPARATWPCAVTASDAWLGVERPAHGTLGGRRHTWGGSPYVGGGIADNDNADTKRWIGCNLKVWPAGSKSSRVRHA